MPITFDITTDRLYNRGIREGRMEGLKEGERRGEIKGERRGEREKAVKIALMMIEEGEPTERIARLTGLTIRELEALKPGERL